MRIVSSRVYRGPSLHARSPAIFQRLDLGALADWPTARLGEAFVDGLLDLLPGLAEARGAPPFPDGMAQALRAAPGLPLSQVYVRIAVELQRLADLEIEIGHELPSPDPRYREVIYGYRDASVGGAAGKAALAVLFALLPAELRPPRAGTETARGRRDRFVRSAFNRSLDQSTRALVQAAEARGIPWFRILPSARYVQLGHGRHQRRIHETVTSNTSGIATTFARDKLTTNRLLAQQNLPVARQARVSDEAMAVRIAAGFGYPVVVKPSAGKKGKGIAIGLNRASQVKAAFGAARRYGDSVIVEKHIAGDDHRMLVVDGELIAAARRVPGAVTGDGRRSIEELVAEVNRDPRRGVGFTKLLNRLKLDAQANAMLVERGYTRASVPPRGEVVQLRRTANISTGGTAVDVTDAVHPDNRKMAVRAAGVVGLDVVGVDFITPDISRSYLEVGGAICEVNSSPGLRPHLAVEGEPRDVVTPIIDMLFPPGRPSRIPIAAITGSNGKTTTARMTAHILKAAGSTVGLTTTDGIYIDGLRTVAGDRAGSKSAQAVLRDPTVDAAVLEIARGGLIRHGLGFDYCNVGAVLNVSAEHLGFDGVETVAGMAEAKRLVVEVARDRAVLNADDELCLAMADFTAAEQVCYVTMKDQRSAIAGHIRAGNPAVTLERAGGEACIVIHDGGRSTPVIEARRIPATLDGRATHQVQNALFAAAVAHGLGRTVEEIRDGLASFDCSFEQLPGRTNVFDGHPFKVILDYGHNALAVAVVCELARGLATAGRRLCVLSAPGNRRDQDIRDVGRAAAGGFDHYLCHREDHRRGRASDEVPGLLREGLIANRTPASAVTVIADEVEALAAGLDMARAGDLLVIFGEAMERCWKQITGYRPGGDG